jgi:hypothetical protein
VEKASQGITGKRLTYRRPRKAEVNDTTDDSLCVLVASNARASEVLC